MRPAYSSQLPSRSPSASFSSSREVAVVVEVQALEVGVARRHGAGAVGVRVLVAVAVGQRQAAARRLPEQELDVLAAGRPGRSPRSRRSRRAGSGRGACPGRARARLLRSSADSYSKASDTPSRSVSAEQASVWMAASSVSGRPSSSSSVSARVRDAVLVAVRGRDRPGRRRRGHRAGREDHGRPRGLRVGLAEALGQHAEAEAGRDGQAVGDAEGREQGRRDLDDEPGRRRPLGPDEDRPAAVALEDDGRLVAAPEEALAGDRQSLADREAERLDRAHRRGGDAVRGRPGRSQGPRAGRRTRAGGGAGRGGTLWDPHRAAGHGT